MGDDSRKDCISQLEIDRVDWGARKHLRRQKNLAFEDPVDGPYIGFAAHIEVGPVYEADGNSMQRHEFAVH